jgi:two-component system copper resistance phosphate regulon response regulator CusR
MRVIRQESRKWHHAGSDRSFWNVGCYDAFVRVLIVEDEPKSAAYLRKGLSEHGYVADLAHNGEDGLYLAQNSDYDLLVLDVMLPGRDGWSVISELRRVGKQTPVLFLTARDSVPDRVKGLELGADDYLVKPFAFSELLARVRTILRRGPVRHSDILQRLDAGEHAGAFTLGELLSIHDYIIHQRWRKQGTEPAGLIRAVACMASSRMLGI